MLRGRDWFIAMGEVFYLSAEILLFVHASDSRCAPALLVPLHSDLFHKNSIGAVHLAIGPCDTIGESRLGVHCLVQQHTVSRCWVASVSLAAGVRVQVTVRLRLWVRVRPVSCYPIAIMDLSMPSHHLCIISQDNAHLHQKDVFRAA